MRVSNPEQPKRPQFLQGKVPVFSLESGKKSYRTILFLIILSMCN